MIHPDDMPDRIPANDEPDLADEFICSTIEIDEDRAYEEYRQRKSEEEEEK